MRIHLITTFFRETFLAPLFLSHYETFCDRITLLTDKFPGDKFDDVLKMNWINRAIECSDGDWCIVVDLDEMIFPLPYGTDPRLTLERETGSIIMCEMVRVWRHRNDKDIDRLLPSVPQRLHGQPDHKKPSVFRPGGVTLGAGNHEANFPAHYKWGKPWGGSHWANADSCFWIDRGILDRGQRLSQENISKGWGIHQLRTREQILQECAAHLDDPIVIDIPTTS
jgi:hypothetical protein